jgi:putative transposase
MSFVDASRDRFGVEPILRVLDIAVSTFYGWQARAHTPSQHALDDQVLTGRIRAIHARSGGTYGAPRIHAQLRRDGIRIGRKRVERLMRAAGLHGAFLRKRWRSSTRQDPRATPAPDLVNRQFTVAEPNRLWVADISRIPTGEGPLWLASVRDAFSRRIVGWKSSDRADTDLVLGALEYAIWGRDLDLSGDSSQPRLIHHSDKGTQYTAIRFTQRLADAGIAASTGSVGDSYDNALAENFFSSLKVELVYRTSFRTREQAELALFRYIDGWYNPHRIQKRLGWRSPDEYEATYHATQATQPVPSTIQRQPLGAM